MDTSSAVLWRERDVRHYLTNDTHLYVITKVVNALKQSTEHIIGGLDV